MDEHIYIDELTNILLKTQALQPEMAKGLDEAFAQSRHESFDAFLLEEGFVDKEGLLNALSILYQVPFMDVEGYFFETFILRKFPKDFLLRNGIIPYEQDENMLIVVAADPADESLLSKIGEHVSYDIRFNVGIFTDIIDAIEEYYDKALTQTDLENEDEVMHNRDQKIRVEDLDNLPVKEEDRDASVFIKEKIDQFAKTATESELKEIEKRAHNAQKKK